MITYDLSLYPNLPKYQALYTLMREDILAGVLASGFRLPSRRALAEHLGVSTATVDHAYQQLVAEGYIHSRERSGYFVAKMDAPRPQKLPSRAIALCSDPEPDIENSSGFEYSVMTKLMREVIAKYDRVLLQKPPHNGCAALRNAIAVHLLHTRGMTAQPADIIVGAGAEYLYGLIVQLLGRDKLFGIETPGYDKIRAVYEANGARCEFLPLDRDGISSEALRRSQADVLHVTPFHSYPTGVTAPASRRLEYLAWAAARGAVLIEDDFDSEFAAKGLPPETLYSMDGGQNVIYLNTFSKSLSPSMRIGYMILPERLHALYEERLGFYSCTVPAFDQYLLAEYISRGFFERHLNRLRKRLREKKGK